MQSVLQMKGGSRESYHRWSDWREFFFKFLFLPGAGTVLHELGHAFVGLALGHSVRVRYAYTTVTPLFTYNSEERLYFLLGGPISTWLTSIIGLIILIGTFHGTARSDISLMTKPHELALYSTLLCVRFVWNASFYLLGVGRGSDEVKISHFLGLNPAFLVYGSAILGIIIMLVAIYMIPKQQRVLVIISGVPSALLGYFLWYHVVGPVLLP